jgi:hypothetical protein
VGSALESAIAYLLRRWRRRPNWPIRLIQLASRATATQRVSEFAHDDHVDLRPIVAVARRIAAALGVARDVARLVYGELLLGARLSFVQLQWQAAVIARQLPHLTLVRQRQPLGDLEPQIALETLQPVDRDQLGQERAQASSSPPRRIPRKIRMPSSRPVTRAMRFPLSPLAELHD